MRLTVFVLFAPQYSLLSPNSMAGGGGTGGSSGWAASGGVEVKGKGVMDTFLWTPPRP